MPALGDAEQGNLVKVLDRLVQEKPQDAYKQLEVISRGIKNGKGTVGPSLDPTLSAEEIEAKSAFATALTKLSDDPKDDSGEPVSLCVLPNFHAEVEMLKSAGVGFSDQETLMISSGLRHFASQGEGLKKLRFWGKIAGVSADYYVAEGVLDAPGAAPDDAAEDFEAPGTGANTFAYWVCTDLASLQWTKLPDTTPEFIKKSKLISKIFSGDLSAKVVAFPYFPGTEADLLRAVIARITAETVLNVAGFLVVPEEGGDIQEAEEFVFKPTSELATISSWTHCTEHILDIGRCTYLELDGENEETKDAFEAQEAQKKADPQQETLRSAAAGDWAVRLVDGNVVSVSNLKYPGAFCVYKNKQHTNIYVGYGTERNGSYFFPKAPPAVNDDADDLPEQSDPQGKVAEAGGEENDEESG